MRGLFVVFATCALGCASSPVLPPPASSTWHLVKTPNFVVHANLDAPAAVRAAEALEAARDAIIAAAWPRLDFEDLEPTDVYVLASQEELQGAFGAGVAGSFHQAGGPRVFLGGPPEQWEEYVDPRFAPTSYLRHELAHQLASVVYGRQPRWFAEGVAQFLETTTSSPDRTTVSMGAPLLRALAGYRRHRSVGLGQMLAWEHEPGQAEPIAFEAFYGLSWLFVHWLYNTKQEPFARFQRALSEGAAPSRAWSAAFPSFDAAATERELEQYSQHGVYSVRTFAVPRRSHSFAATTLSQADGHVCRALVATAACLVNGGRRAALYAEIRAETLAARTLAPDNIEALMMSFGGDPLDLSTRASRAVAAHPDDPRGYLLLSRAREGEQEHGPASEAALRRAVELAPRNSRALNDLAWLLVETGRVGEALGLARRAVRRAPWNDSILDTYARALFLSGECERALAIQRQATDASADRRRIGPALAERRKHLAEYKEVCGAAGQDE
jgi:hypothetical protein